MRACAGRKGEGKSHAPPNARKREKAKTHTKKVNLSPLLHSPLRVPARPLGRRPVVRVLVRQQLLGDGADERVLCVVC